MVEAPGEWLARLAHKADLRARAGLRRALHPRGTGDHVIDLAGNDYLGLSRHPAVLADYAACRESFNALARSLYGSAPA